MPNLADDFINLARRHAGKILIAGMTTVGGMGTAGMGWAWSESQRLDRITERTAETLRAHMRQEREQYQSLMDVLDNVQATTQSTAIDVAVLRYRLDSAATPAGWAAQPKIFSGIAQKSVDPGRAGE